MKNIIFLLFLSTICNSQENNLFRIYFKDGTTKDVINLKNVSSAINCESLDGMNSLSFPEKKYHSYRQLNPNIAFFEFRDKKFTDFVVVTIDSLSQNKLYERTINWIKEKYKNPESVIKMTIENEKIRFEGYKENLYFVTRKFLGAEGTTYYGGNYTIEISLKNGKYKFDPVNLEYHVKASPNQLATNIPILLDDLSYLYNEKGIISDYINTPIILDDLFNSLNTELYEYILNQGKGKKSDW